MASKRTGLHPCTALLVLVALSGGCDRWNGQISAESSQPEEKTAQVTVWGERFEIFLEHRPLVAGSPTTFATHVTDVQTLEPRREGRITFVLHSEGGPPTERVELAPARPGIYQPQLTFPSAGKWTLSLRIPVEAAESVVTLPPLTVYASREAALTAPEPEAPDGVTFLKEQQWKVLVGTEPVGKRRLVERLRLSGVVSPRPEARAAVTPPVSGRLLPPPNRTLPTLGERVEAGQVLALVQPPFSDFAAKILDSEAGAIRARLEVDQAELALARTQKLALEKAASERELQAGDFALRTARASHDAALAVRDSYRKAGAIFVSSDGAENDSGLPSLALRAPIAGVIAHVGAAVGEYVPSDEPVFRIVDTSFVLIEARIPESDIGRIGASRAALYETRDAKGRLIPILGGGGGQVVFLGLEINPSTRTLPLIYAVPNPEGRLRIGMGLNVYVETDRVEDALAIAESALVDEDGRAVAFVQVAGETFQKRDLTLGIREGGFAQVISGLSEGERVVTKGGYAIRLASVSTTIPAHGHAH